MWNKKGFVAVYCLVFLCCVLFYGSLVYASIQQYQYFRENLNCFRRMNNAETLAILRIKRQFKEYAEENEKIRYKGCLIEIEYEATTAYLTLTYQGIVRERQLEYDELSETIKEIQ